MFSFIAALGFTAGGIAAGSIGSAMMSASAVASGGGVVAGGVVSSNCIVHAIFSTQIIIYIHSLYTYVQLPPLLHLTLGLTIRVKCSGSNVRRQCYSFV